MGLYKKLDFWSVMDELDRMIDYDYNGNEKDSHCLVQYRSLPSLRY